MKVWMHAYLRKHLCCVLLDMTNFRRLNQDEYDKVWDKFYDLFCEAYDAVETKSDKASSQFDKLLQVMEAVLAYHKFYGGQ